MINENILKLLRDLTFRLKSFEQAEMYARNGNGVYSYYLDVETQVIFQNYSQLVHENHSVRLFD